MKLKDLEAKANTGMAYNQKTRAANVLLGLTAVIKAADKIREHRRSVQCAGETCIGEKCALCQEIEDLRAFDEVRAKLRTL